MCRCETRARLHVWLGGTDVGASQPGLAPHSILHAPHHDPAGFNAAFWQGYFEVAPKAPLMEQRRDLYTLYHILNVCLGLLGRLRREADASLRHRGTDLCKRPVYSQREVPESLPLHHFPPSSSPPNSTPTFSEGATRHRCAACTARARDAWGMRRAAAPRPPSCRDCPLPASAAPLQAESILRRLNEQLKRGSL